MGMTGKKYRQELGLPDPKKERILSEKTFKVPGKFKGIPRHKRMKFLKTMSKKVIEKRNLEEIKQFRRGFQQHKLSQFPFSILLIIY